MTTGSRSHVLLSRHEAVGLITLNRPEKLNAFDDRMRFEIVEAVRAAAADDAIRAIVITGAGRAFCAGADVARMYELVTAEEWDTLAALVDAGADVVRIIDGLDKPVLAAVNGVAAGGGANLALACDIRVAGTSATIIQSFIRLGLHPDWGGTYFLPRLIGVGRALELALTGDSLAADDALRMGVFNRLVADERVLDDTMTLAARIAAKPSTGIARVRRAFRQAHSLTLSEALDVERRNQVELFRSAFAREAMRAFLEKRSPTFTAQQGHHE
jgi:2-(1,2-epoxy-1,2-dihydrophenyl)acetyl-CoA isomerase